MLKIVRIATARISPACAHQLRIAFTHLITDRRFCFAHPYSELIEVATIAGQVDRFKKFVTSADY